MGSLPFVESFVLKVFQKDFNTIVSRVMLTDPQAAFVTFSFCYAQRPNYLQYIVFPSLGILQRYTEFDVRNIIMLEKQLGSISFGTIVGHLVCCQITFLISSGGLGLSLMVGRATPALLRGWAFIVLTLIFRF